ncbi:hypothetical protein K0C01_03575 [Salinarchaeum sp. IM2453]|uniref:DUF5789 family protein n=1 Tax=Salinarchaeum sp. IM2453 TaxID=2862870 RepID=UPI001C828B8D|nr:hypothetical protein [Salinarchaeum sp. IM2453]QZA89238.1 hypothetical protein K0C01_03575 [Salinarchaeum sp. IM2453]
MGARPPTNDNEDPEMIEFGIAAIDARLKDSTLSYPATAEEVATAVGTSEVPYDAKGRSVAIEKVLEETGKEEFGNRQELMNSLHEVFEEYREKDPGMLSQIRSMLPF